MYCVCGCGQKTESTWAPGCDSKTLWKVLEMELGVTNTLQLIRYFGYNNPLGAKKNDVHTGYRLWKKDRSPS